MLRRFILLFTVSLICPLGGIAETVVLSNGDVLDAVSVEPIDTGWRVEHPVLGTLELAGDAVARIDSPAAAPTPPVSAEPTPEPADRGVFGSGWLIGFDRAFSFGLSGARGNSDNLDATVGLDIDFEDDETRWIFDGRFYYAESSGTETKNQGYADLTRDWLLTDRPYFYFGQIRWDVDEFEAWDHRGTVSGGVGWNLHETETLAVRARTGLAVTRTFGGTDEETDYELLIRFETDWKPSEHQTLTAYNATYPSMKDTGEFRNLTGIQWKINFADSPGLALQLGLENEYESDVPRGTDRNDLQYNASLVVGF